MAGVFPNEGRIAVQGRLLPYLNLCTLGLFVSNHTPVVADTKATYTAIEATFAGYAQVAITTFVSLGIDGNGNEQIQATAVVFTASGSGLPQTVYGYFLFDAANKVIAAELDPAPFTLTSGGDTYTVTLNLYVGAVTPPL